jgi:hypothetical protein
MTRSRTRGMLVLALVLASCLVGFICVWNRTHRNRPGEEIDPVPPFTGMHIHGFEPAWVLQDMFEEDEAEAERHYKGKIFSVSMGYSPWTDAVQVDGDGRKYVSCGRLVPGKPLRREAIRGYLYRPDDPIVEEAGGGERWGIKGICKGIRGGVVIPENCTIYTEGGNDW